MTKDQKIRVQELKAESDWTDGNTPPSAFFVDDNSYPTKSNQLVSAIQSTISELNTVSNATHEHVIVPLPPVPTGILIPPTPMVITDASSIGSSFGEVVVGKQYNITQAFPQSRLMVFNIVDPYLMPVLE